MRKPYFETWPPATHTNILFANKGLTEPAYAREVIRRFAERAYRGPIASAELDRLMKYWTKARATAETPEESVRETLGVVLSSPRFLGLPASRSGGAKETLTDHELASRMSYLLWSTMPDETLRRLADQGKLRDSAVLSEQIRRMIKDPKAWAFIEQFTEQWLEIDRLQRVAISKERYPGFDDQLAAAMRLETIHFFGEVLRGDMSIFQFLNSDFTCVNDAMAAHYGIQGVTGPQFRKVKLDEAHHRGGVLTHVPSRIFERLFEPPASGDLAARKQALASGRRRVDFLLDDSRSLRNNPGPTSNGSMTPKLAIPSPRIHIQGINIEPTKPHAGRGDDRRKGN